MSFYTYWGGGGVVNSGEGTCRWFTTPISECPSPCQGTVSRNVFCLCTPPNGVVNAEDANCERDDANVSKPVSELTCEVGCPDTARVTPSTDLGSAFEPTIALNFDPTEPTEPPTTIRLLTAAQIIELGGDKLHVYRAMHYRLPVKHVFVV